ncbi:MAG TPA: glycosyltransferase family 2 protein [Sphingobacteriaceae bacterium]
MFLLYVVFLFLILRFTVTLFNFISNPKLTLSGKHYDDLVSILIPESNEDYDVLTLLQSIHSQDYKNLEVLIAATDKPLLNPGYTAIDSRFKIIAKPDLPAGWSDKNFSYYILSKAAKGKYLLFLDPRTIIANGLINNAVNRMKIQRLTLLSLFTNQLMLSFGERLVVPLINYLLLNLVPLRLIRLSKNAVFSISSGQFMMFDAQTYNQHEWHEVAKTNREDSNELMRLVKSWGYHAEVLLANGYIYSRLYTGFSTSIQGLSRNIITHFGSITALFIYIFLVILGPVAIGLYMGAELLLFAITLIVLSRIMTSLASGQNPWLNIILHPVQMLSLVLISVLSVQQYYTKPVNRHSNKMRF